MLPLLVFIFDLGFFAASLLPPAKKPNEVDQVDLIAVLTGGQGRLREALLFLQENKGKYLFISGVDKNSDLNRILRANKIRNFPEALRPQIYLGAESSSTLENAIEIHDIVERFDAKSVLVVTSTYHMQRALRMLKRELKLKPGVQIELYSYPVESPNFDRERWWWSPTAWTILLWEYLKSLPFRMGL